MKLGRILKDFRNLHKISMEEMAKRCGVSKAYIGFIESGINPSTGKSLAPSIDTLKKLANGMGMSIDDLIPLMGDDEISLSNEPDISSIPGIIPIRKIKKIPILGTICAGDGVWCEENYDDYISVDGHIKADFALHVQGDSMLNANIHDGDIAFFKKINTVGNGQIACVLLTETNEVMLKKVLFADNTAILQPCNDEYKPIITNNFIVLGLLKGIYKEINQ